MIEIGRRPLTCVDVEAVASGREHVSWPDRPAAVEPASGSISPRILAHCVGVGPPLPEDEVRAILFTCAARRDESPLVVDALLRMLDTGPLPVIPSQGDHGGSVSTTLAHVARALSLPAEGDALPTFVYGGTICTAALAALAVVRASRVYSAFDEACFLMEGVESGRGVSSGRAWEILHATSEALEHARETTELSMSPGGAFREPQVSGAMDGLRVALTQAATASERRVFRMTTGSLSGLPSFLVPTSGVHSGLMLAQYTAASLVSEMRTASQPVAVDTIPAFGHDEDWTPRGPAAARAALAAVDLAADVAAIELLCAAQACDLGRATLHDDARAVRDQVRTYVRYRDTDRVLHPDIAALGNAVRQGLMHR